jgi:hypothetical protein
VSLDSPGEIIPFTRFLEHRERLHRIAAAKVMVMPVSTELGIQSNVTGSADVNHGESPRCFGTDPRSHANLRGEIP